MDSNTRTNETDFIKRYLIYERVTVLSYFEIAGLVLASDLSSPYHHHHQFLCMLWHCYGNPEGWWDSLHLFSQRVMRQEWWIVCWRLCSRGLPSATEEKGHQSQKVNIILVSCYFLGNYHKEQPFSLFPFNSFKVVCQECSALGNNSSEVSWVCLILPLQWQMSEREAFQLADVSSTLTNQSTEPRKSWLVWQVSSEEPYAPYPSGVYCSIIKWEVKVITSLLQVFQGIEALLWVQTYLTFENSLILLTLLEMHRPLC